nr:DMT family transporter [uncultured Clostridium sp.]
MYNFLSLLTGVIISFMLAVNGSLAAQYGIFGAAVIIHIAGVLFALLLLKLLRIPSRKTAGKIPWWLYTGGMIGVLTTAFSNFAYGKISITGIIALGLLGQAIASLVTDWLGLFGMTAYPPKKHTLAGLILAFLGIAVMLNHSFYGTAFPVLISLLSGITVVLSRTVNAGLSEKTGALMGSFINHLTGLPVTLILLFLLGRDEAIFKNFIPSSHVWIYLGGVLGVFTVLLFNVTVPKIPSFRLTLLSFTGQIFTGILLDLITQKGFTMVTFSGGLLVAAGVGITMAGEQFSLLLLNKSPASGKSGI